MYHKPIINHSYWSYQIITVAKSGLQLFQIQKENGICPKMASQTLEKTKRFLTRFWRSMVVFFLTSDRLYMNIGYIWLIYTVYILYVGQLYSQYHLNLPSVRYFDT